MGNAMTINRILVVRFSVFLRGGAGSQGWMEV